MKTFIVIAIMLNCESLAVAATSPNFTCNHSDKAFAQQVVDVAEHERDVRAMQWLGKTLPEWSKRCTINAKITQSTGGGSTKVDYDRGSATNWRMHVEGTKGAILNTSIPHEVTHTIIGCYFRRPTPRWADEGIATLSEGSDSWDTQYICLKQTWDSHPISFAQMMRRKEYGNDMNVVMSFYARSAYATAYLVKLKGRAEFLRYIDTANEQGWDNATQKHYGKSVAAIEQEWRGWVAQKPIIHEVQQQRRLHLYYFYRSDIVCPGCVAADAGIARGEFSQFKITKIDTAKREGYELYKGIAEACKAANPGFVDERSVPAFHLENRASIHYGYSRARGPSELGTWVKSTLRLPLSMTEAIFSRPKIYSNSPIAPPPPPEPKPEPLLSSTWEEMEANTTPFKAPEPPKEVAPAPDIKGIVKSAVITAVKDALAKQGSEPTNQPIEPAPKEAPGGVPELLFGAVALAAKRWAARKMQAA